MDINGYKWHFFIAHASADAAVAESLRALLAPHCKVFLDNYCLLLGDSWEEELPAAQRNSLITVVLVSSNTGKAYYQNEEIAGAIDMAREDKDKHRVVPVFLEEPSDIVAIPYGLRSKHRLDLFNMDGLPAVSRRLLELLDKLKEQQNFVIDNHEKDLNDKSQKAKTSDHNNEWNVNSETGVPEDYNKQPNNNPINQSQFTQYPQPGPPPFTANMANSYVMRCVFVNDPNAYYVTNSNAIVMVNPYGQAMQVGRRIPPIFPNLAWMYQTASSMYGVTFQGYIFATFPNGQTLQIGYVTNP
ncbi:toll/interleukin-1 receptor domain-containing protein [Segetibacter aerophilus]|uniref:TIR domain-containing protein n=1 Tax=Segetibacter aerophilus TaxID=670293 RepID=A0A512B7T5_9BACT|nr:toll/interleukin-1 receptor domain-containing protein [Segetibacter aerophilus]GEO08021.1 hypothetical protein SAE01_05170 [Segetibacter aerophilus]